MTLMHCVLFLFFLYREIEGIYGELKYKQKMLG